jgi:hypothetical protein
MFHGMFFLALCMGLYFLPAIIGSKKHNATAILAVNLLLGWTVIGWIVALVWALSEAPVPGGMPGYVPSPPSPQAPPGPYVPPAPYVPQPAPHPQPAPPAPQGRYCSKCGSALRAGDKFCAGCGSGVPGV